MRISVFSLVLMLTGTASFMAAAVLQQDGPQPRTGSQEQHTSNWAVLVSTSKFWYNYRHMANILGIYRTVKRLGIADSHIILMLAEDIACNTRNLFPGAVFNNADRALDLYGGNIEVDYRGSEVTVENFIRMLTGRLPYDTPRSKQLLSDEHSNVLIYVAGHGGNEFFKFQDVEELNADELADAMQQMYERGRYNQLLFIADTCQATSLYSKFYSPNIIGVGSSQTDESSYSHHSDYDVGVAVIDRFTYYCLEYLENQVSIDSNQTLADLFDSLDPEKLFSRPGVRTDLISRPLNEIKITEFFGHVPKIEKDNDASSDEDLLQFSDDDMSTSGKDGDATATKQNAIGTTIRNGLPSRHVHRSTRPLRSLDAIRMSLI